MLQQQGPAQAAAGALDLQVDALQRPALAPQQTVSMLTPVDRLMALRQSLGSGAAAAAAQRQDHMGASQHQERQGGQASPPSSLLRHLQQRLFGARGNEGIQILPHSSRHWEDCVLAQMGSSCQPLCSGTQRPPLTAGCRDQRSCTARALTLHSTPMVSSCAGKPLWRIIIPCVGLSAGLLCRTMLSRPSHIRIRQGDPFLLAFSRSECAAQ